MAPEHEWAIPSAVVRGLSAVVEPRHPMYELLEGRAPLHWAHNPRYQQGHYTPLAPEPPCASESDDASDDDRRQSPLGRGHDDYVISGEESVSDASSDA